MSRTPSRCALLVALILLTAGASHAGTFDLIATLEVGAIGTHKSYLVTGSGSRVTSVGGGVAQIPAGLFPATLAGLISPPDFGLDNVQVVGGGLPAGTLDAGAPTNVLPLLGIQQLRQGTRTDLTVAQSPIGGGGTAMGSLLDAFAVTLSGSPWLLGVHTVTGTGLGARTQVLSGFDARTEAGRGVVRFVSPGSTRIPGFPVQIPTGGILTLEYVTAADEPGALWLGALLLLLLLGFVRSSRLSPALRSVLLGVAVSIVPATTSHAGTFDLVATLDVGPIGGVGGYQVTGSASGVTSIGGGVAQIPAGLFPATIAGILSPVDSGFDNFRVVGGGLPAGTLNAALSTNALPLQGTHQVLAGAIQGGFMAQTPIGGGGTAMGIFGGLLPVTLSGSPWLLGIHTVVGAGLASGVEQVLSGFDARTASGAGVVQFVSPATARVAALPVLLPTGSTLTLEYLAAATEPMPVVLLSVVLFLTAARVRSARPL
ncbi:MAG: hypothetical protein QNK05_00275 [Myxococcota bacterium]|nr:hypothetical protein [Myxococcota bacterium]